MILMFDLDDTLLKKDKSISSFTISTLKEMKEKGHILVINTLRCYVNGCDVAKMIDADYGVYGGGALITNKNGEEVYSFNSFSKDKANELIRKILPYSKDLMVETKFVSYFNNKENLDHKHHYCNFSTELMNEPVNKIIAYLNPDIPFPYSEFVESEDFDFFHYDTLDLDLVRIMPKNLDKKNGNEYFRKAYPDQKIMAFGNHYADLEMILEADVGVLMDNADKKTKRKANIICSSNEDDGLAKYLKEYFKDEVVHN